MLSDQFKKLARRLAWFLPGFLLWAAFPPMGEGADALFALAPLLWLVRRRETGVAVRRCFGNGLFFWVATLSWMPAIVKNGGPWPLVVLGWFALAAYCAAYFALFGFLASRYWTWARGTSFAAGYGAIGLRLLGVLFVEPVLWCGLELARSRLFGGFAWNQLGVVPVNMGFGAPAALGGVYLLSAVVVLVNGTFAGIAERVWRPERSGFAGLKKFGSLETLGAVALVAGIYALAPRATGGAADADAPTLKVALVQRNFPCVFRSREENPYETYGRLLSNVALLKPDLVVLSESSLAEFGPADQQGAMRFASFVQKQTGAALLAGGTHFADGNTYNSAVLFPIAAEGAGSSDLRPSFYDKVHLVPFGEFIPGDKIFPALQKLAPVGSCTPGEERLLTLPKTATHPSVPLGVAICFEDTDSALIRRAAARGAELLVFITNDSWFSRSDEALAHAWQATARAVETGLPVVRVGNSGVTGTISPTGKATWLLGTDSRPLVDRAGTMLDRIATGGTGRIRTAYVRFGDVPLVVLFTLLILGMILVKYKANYGSNRTLSM